MNRTQAHRALLKTSSVLCAVLFVGVCVSILDARPSSAAGPSLAEVPELAYNVVTRVPASLLLKEKHKAPPIKSFKVWQPPCLQAKTKFEELKTDSSWIRISTQSCDEDQEIAESKLENKSNGYVATIFSTSANQLTSDFIPLVDGANQFQMDVKLESGKHFNYQWTVERTPATASN